MNQPAGTQAPSSPPESTRRSNLEEVTHEDGTHAGLWLDRYLTDSNKKKNGKVAEVIKEVTDKFEAPKGYQRAFERRKTALEELDGGVEGGVTRLLKLTFRGRVIVGIGEETVRETGIHLLRAWGMPVIPGSSLKGLCQATAHRSEVEGWKKPPLDASDEEGPESREHRLSRQLFGTVEAAGWVTFHDAWWEPTKKPPLHLDVMTVHHPDYYTKGSHPSPAETDSPIPISFVSSTGTFLAALSGPPLWVDAAVRWLKKGLGEEGIGAKTAVGYGRGEVEVVPTRREREEEESRKKKEERVRQEDEWVGRCQRWDGNPGDLHPHMERVRKGEGEGMDPRALTRALNHLLAKNTKAVRDWEQKHASEPEWEALITRRLIPLLPLLSSPSPLASSPQELAFMEKREGRDFLIYREEGDEEWKEGGWVAPGTIDGALTASLSRASRAKPVPVRITWKKEKVKGVNRR